MRSLSDENSSDSRSRDRKSRSKNDRHKSTRDIKKRDDRHRSRSDRYKKDNRKYRDSRKEKSHRRKRSYSSEKRNRKSNDRMDKSNYKRKKFDKLMENSSESQDSNASSHKRYGHKARKERVLEEGIKQKYPRKDSKSYKYDKDNDNQASGDRNNSQEKPKKEKKKPCFVPSGIQASFSNKINGVVLKFTVPLDGAEPEILWRLFPFEKNQETEYTPISLTGKSVFLLGKDFMVSDIVLDHVMCSKQHAVIQFRHQTKELDDGTYSHGIKPYIMDLESTNGTFLNGEKIENSRYYELLNEDVIKFAMQETSYVIMSDPDQKLRKKEA